MLSSGVGANPERWQLNMTPGVTASAHDVYQLHMIIFLVCCVIGVIVFGAIFYSILKFRKSQGAVAEKWSHNTTAEIIWTVVPILILVVMAVPATKTLMRMADTGDAEMTVKITGYQWKWRYEYVGTDVSFISSLARESDAARRLGSGVDVATVSNYLLDVDKPLILPTDTKIRFVITADDVIHSWWVPVLGWKQDAIPGFINEAWTSIKDPGTYRGQCAELCGKDHGFMPIVVEAKPKAEFQAWLAQQQAARPDVEATVKVDAAASDDQS
ncbi:MAG: cytochrome c oxidase subunit II [Lysobacterales bacterium]